MSPDWSGARWAGAREGELPAQVHAIIDASAADLVRLVLGLAVAFDVYDGDAGDFDADRIVCYDLPGGAGLINLDGLLDEADLRVLREVLDCAVDVQR